MSIWKFITWHLKERKTVRFLMCLDRACQESCCKQYGQVFLAPTRPWLDSSETKVLIGQDMYSYLLQDANRTALMIGQGTTSYLLQDPYWTALKQRCWLVRAWLVIYYKNLIRQFWKTRDDWSEHDFLSPTRPLLDSSETKVLIGQDMSFISYKTLTGKFWKTRDDWSGHDFLSPTRP